MADIRVERKSGSRIWLWVLLAVVLLIVAVLLLDRAGYIDLPVNLGSIDSNQAWPTQLASVPGVVQLQEA